MADVTAEITKLAKLVEKLAETEDANAGKLDKQIAAVEKLPEPRMRITGLVKTYMDAVKDTDSLTSVRPATLKAVQTAEKDPAKAGAIASAVAELNKHAADVKGQKDKKAKAFQAAVSSIVGQIEKLA